MDESNSDALADAAAPPPVTAEEPQQQAEAEAEQQQQEEGEGYEEEEEEEGEKSEEDELIEKAQKLMEKITSAPDNPNPAVLHALSCILETQESLYMEEHDQSSFNNNRASHLVGRLGNLVRENDDFFELISSKFLSESRYSTSVQAASSRLLLSCSLTWTYPHVFEDDVLENIRNWVLEDTPRTTEEHILKHGVESKGATDFEMLKTYSTGLLAVCLTGGGQLLEDVLTSGLPSKLMRYLRIRILGESSTSQKIASHIMENRAASGTPSVRGREEGRSRVRQVLETAHLDDSRMVDGRSIDDLTLERNHEGVIGQLGDEGWVDGGELREGLAEGVDTFGLNAEGEEKLLGRDLRDVKTKPGDTDELGREDLSRRRGSRGLARSRGKGWSEGTGESEQVLTSPGSGNRQVQGRATKDRGVMKILDLKKGPDGGKYSGKTFSDVLELEKADNEDYSQECIVGGKDISDLVKKAVRAAKAEARAANAPAEAVKAAADAAAEVVRSAAFEEFKATNDEEAAVLAASKAAATVIDAANATEAFSCRSSNHLNTDSVTEGPAVERKEDTEEYFILDFESLSQLREKYCIQCLEVLGEYVEVLGPVLHEKGVDVCLALLHRSSGKDGLNTMLLPDVTKLICALAAHRKFSALFVDRGGMQKLLSVPRTVQTFFGLSSCLFAIGSLQGIMERVCALPADVVHQIVELAVVLIECSQDQARKNAALFFAAAFVFRAVLDAFDAQDGLQKLLGLLNDAASVRSGVNSLALAASGSLRNDRSTAEVLTSSEKQIAYHTCVALRQYFRAHLLLLVDSIRPNKSNRSFGRNIPSVRAANKPLDISNEAMDAVFLQLQKDRKLGPAFVRTRWPAVDKFLGSNGHIIMLELCQAPPVERYLHDLLQYALGVLHIVTLVPYSRKPILSTTLSNNRVGIAIVLDAANIASNYVDPEIIQPALNVLINLVCPPPSLSNKPSSLGQGESNVERSGTAVHGVQSVHNTPQTAPSTPASGLVGDRRITLGTGAGSAGLAAQLEQGYRQAREAVRANNGIKVLLHLLQPRAYSPPAALDCIRALTCRVLLGLARDDTIAHILTKLQVGKKLSELIRDSGSQTPGSELSRWQTELSQVAIELIAIVTNSGRASTSAASDAATPTLRRIERAAIAAATPISYHSKELLQLIHEHLQASGLTNSAATLLKEAQLIPLPSLAAPSSLAHQVTSQDLPSVQLQWPAGRTACGFLTDEPDISARERDPSLKGDASVLSLKKKSLAFSPILGLQSVKNFGAPKQSSAPASSSKALPELTLKQVVDAESNCKTPILLPLKRKLSELKNAGFSSSGKRRCTGEQGLRSPICPTPGTLRKSTLSTEVTGLSTPGLNFRDQNGLSTPNVCVPDNLDENQSSSFHAGLMTPSSQVGALNDNAQSGNGERLTLDTLVVQYLKHQHRQCPAPITTLPPLSLLQPHVCPEPKRSLEAPSNITARLGTREFRSIYGGMHGNRRDRQFVYSRFRPWRTCRDDINPLLTCMAFLGMSSHIAVGTHSGELRIFDTNNNSVLESCASHQSPVTIVQSCISSESQLLLSSSYQDVLLWDATSISGGPMHTFEGCKAGRFGNSGNIFAALSSEPSQREICLYDIPTCHLELKLSDTDGSSNARGHLYSPVHFSPSDTMLLWNGVLWDRRVSGPVHRFDQFTDYGGGGFHPAGNEVIINSEVWDLRKFRLLRSVPSLDQTAITFNAHGDVIYAILRRNHEDVMSVVHPRRAKHPLFASFRTVDAVTYSDIATVPVDRCVLDFATEPTDSFVGLVTLDDHDEMFSSARIYETGRRRPTDDDSDPDDAESEEDEDDDEDDGDIDPVLGTELGDGDSDGEDISNEDDDDSASDLDDDDDEGDFIMNDMDFDGGGGILEIVTDGEHDDDDDSDLVEGFSSSGDDEDYVGNDFGY